MPVIDKIYVRKWLLWRAVQYVLTGITCIFLVLSIARIINVSLVNWPYMAVWIINNYGDVLIWLGRTIIAILSNIPLIAFDCLTVYLLIGALTRLAIIDIGLKEEKNLLDLGPDFWNDQFVKDGIKEAREGWQSESKWFYLFWPVRVISDLRGGFFSLTPKLIIIYLGIVLVLFIVAALSFAS